MSHAPRCLVVGLVAGLAFGVPSVGQAQGSPSADQIINSLKPTNGMLGGTRGIRPVTPEAPAAEPAPAARPHNGGATPQVATSSLPTGHGPISHEPSAAAAPSVNLSVQFATNSAVLTPAAVRTLSELGRALSSSTLASYRFRIEGHTDTVGQPEANKALSERRAQAAVAFLTSTFKIDPSRLEAVGLGEDGLVVQTPPNTPEPRNRRVQVINLGA